MAVEVRRFAVTVPAGTLQANPQVTSLAMPARIVRRVEIKVPPGPHGLVGFQLTSGGVPMIPINPGQFLTPDGETIGWDLDGFIDSGAWQITAYNTGAFNHTLELRFLCDPTATAAAAASSATPPIIDAAALSSGL